MERGERNINLDALRVFAILGVITLHLVGGVNTLQLSTGNRIVVNILLAITYTAVNLFGLLSGYLKIDRPHHNAAIIKIILQTAFWCFLITAICVMFLGVRSPGDIIKYAFPFLGDRLWYITCYFFVFMCAPFLNLLANKISKSGYLKLLIVLGILMSMITTVCFKDFFHVVSNGYSAGWLIYMYLIGGYFKKYGFWDKASKGWFLLILCVSVIAIIASKYVIEFLQTKVSIGSDRSWHLYYYSSPLTLLNSICIFYLFVTGRWKNNGFGKVLTWLSTVSLGVYIIHAHPYSLDHVLIGENLTWTVNSNPLVSLIILIASILGICLGLGVLEWLRLKLFSVCGIDRWTKKVGEKLDKVLAIEEMV